MADAQMHGRLEGAHWVLSKLNTQCGYETTVSKRSSVTEQAQNDSSSSSTERRNHVRQMHKQITEPVKEKSCLQGEANKL